MPSAQNEALRQALSTRGGAISAAFAYADAAEVLELLLDALENDLDDWRRPCTSVGYQLVRQPCLLCGDSSRAGPMNEKRDVRAFPVIAASILHLLESSSTPPDVCGFVQGGAGERARLAATATSPARRNGLVKNYCLRRTRLCVFLVRWRRWHLC